VVVNAIVNADDANQASDLNISKEYAYLAKDLLRTMRITTNARFEASKRLRLLNSICFLSTTLASLGLILIPLLDLAGHNKAFSETSLTVFQIFLAVCVLVYSTTISAANFQVRSKEYLECGDKIKSIVNDFKLSLVDQSSIKQPDLLNKYMDMYSNALIGTENHEDVDYLRALSLFNKKEARKKDSAKGLAENSWKTYMYKPFQVFFAFVSWLHMNKSDLAKKLGSYLKIYMPFFILISSEALFIGDMVGLWSILTKLHVH
jgi:hypothetical protein